MNGKDETEAAARDVTDWNEVYGSAEESGGWEYLSRIIVRALLCEAGHVEGKRFVEVGSGSGRNSTEIVRRGGRVTLLDLSPRALEAAKRAFSGANLRMEAVNASLFAMPFRDCSFDVVWNAGVIEHWTGEEQAGALREMLRVCRKDGLLITLNPYAGSLLHVAGKWLMKRMGKYPYVDAVNVTTLSEQAARAGGELVRREYSVGFFVLFIGGLLQLSLTVPGLRFCLMPLFRLSNALFSRMDAGLLGTLLRRADRLMAGLLGGYLVVSVIRRREDSRSDER